LAHYITKFVEIRDLDSLKMAERLEQSPAGEADIRAAGRQNPLLHVGQSPQIEEANGTRDQICRFLRVVFWDVLSSGPLKVNRL
jgi:hypothetical protein